MLNMNRKKNIFYNILKVSLSNIFKLIAGILVGFLLPKLIGVTDYGYYKTFTLYASYVGLFHFGLADGIYLKFGDKNYEELNKKDFRYYSQFYFIVELIVSIIVTLITYTIFVGEYKFIFICEAVYLLAINVTNYYQLISQITNRFSELSIRNVINSILIIVSLLVMWGLTYILPSCISYKFYLVMYDVIMVVLAIWYVYTYRDITFGIKTRHSFKEMFNFVKLGFPLLLAGLCSSLVLTLDRQFVSLLFDIKTYAIYAFAYSMLNLITTAISAISTVLYPTLKRVDDKILEKTYSKLVGAVLVLIYGCMLVFFPLCYIVYGFLPQYVDSLEIFRIIFPGIAVSCTITIVMHNYYKTIGWVVQYFIKCVCILVLSALANYLAYYIFKTPAAISMASVFTLIIWYIIVERSLIKKYGLHWKKNFLYLILMMISFYAITNITNNWIACFVYLAVYLLITLLLFGKDIIEIVKTKN